MTKTKARVIKDPRSQPHNLLFEGQPYSYNQGLCDKTHLGVNPSMCMLLKTIYFYDAADDNNHVGEIITSLKLLSLHYL